MHSEGKAVTDKKRLDWMERHVINVRVPLRYGSRDLLWYGPPTEYDPGESLRVMIDQMMAKGQR
jgi:hypothetical protein